MLDSVSVCHKAHTETDSQHVLDLWEETRVPERNAGTVRRCKHHTERPWVTQSWCEDLHHCAAMKSEFVFCCYRVTCTYCTVSSSRSLTISSLSAGGWTHDLIVGVHGLPNHQVHFDIYRIPLYCGNYKNKALHSTCCHVLHLIPQIWY